MPPEIAAVAVPGGKPVAEDRAVTPIGELLQAAEKAARCNDSRQRLDEPEAVIGRKAAGQLYHGVRRDQAVRIEHDHCVIGAAPAGYPVGDVSRLAFGVDAAMAIEHRAFRQCFFGQRREYGLFADPRVGGVCIAEKEKGKLPRRFCAEPGRHGAHACGDPLRFFVVDG